MNIVFLLSLIATVIYNFYRTQAIICKPPNEFVQIFAPPGTGKTTLAAKYVRESLISGKKIYSNVPIISATVFDLKDIGKWDIRDCTIIIDEAGSQVSNRQWHTNLNDKQIEFLKEHRHNNVNVYLFSQAYGDVDNKFRELTTQLLMLKKSRLPFVIKAMAINKTMDLINGQIVQFFEWDKWNSFRFINVPLWAYFNSYQTKILPKKKIEPKYTKSDTIKNK